MCLYHFSCITQPTNIMIPKDIYRFNETEPLLFYGETTAEVKVCKVTHIIVHIIYITVIMYMYHKHATLDTCTCNDMYIYSSICIHVYAVLFNALRN